MSNSAVSEYLTDQIFSENRAVTYRSLSRAFSIHVDTAKNELASFYEQYARSSQPCYATYVLSGDPVSSPKVKSNGHVNADTNGVNVGENELYESDDGEEVPQTRVLLVGEVGLQNAKTQFEKGYLIHVYSLSHKPLTNGERLSEAIASVRAFDGGQRGAEGSATCGKIIGDHIERSYNVVDLYGSTTELMELDVQAPKKTTENQKTDNTTNKSKLKPTKSLPEVKNKDKAKENEKDTQSKAKVKPKDTVKKGKEKEAELKDTKPLEKSKTAGKLDWSKGKTKKVEKRDGEMFISGDQETNSAKSSGMKMKKEESPEPKRKLFISGDSKGKGITKRASPEAKRGIKRKTINAMFSDTEPEEPSTSAIPSKPSSFADSSRGTRIKKGVVLSDDEDGSVVVPKRKAKAKPEPTELDSGSDDDRDRSVRAMMDVDDELIDRISHARLLTDDDSPELELKDEGEDVQMTDVVVTEEEQEEEVVVKPKPRKRKPKKVIPVGRNGLKKKRLVKSTFTQDTKGYDVTEDYSSYESVDEEEPEPEPKPKTKAVAKTALKKLASEPSQIVESGTSMAKSSVTPKATTKSATKATTKMVKGGSKLVGQKSSITNFFGPAIAKKK